MNPLLIVTLVIACAGVAIFVLAIALYFVRLWKQEPKCEHAFTLEQVTDLNHDPKCEYCNKYLSAIDPHQEFQFTWDQEKSIFHLTKASTKRK